MSAAAGGAGAGAGAGADETVTIVSAEGERFTIPKNVALMSGLVKMMIEDSDATEE
jgi:hypothetical protein